MFVVSALTLGNEGVMRKCTFFGMLLTMWAVSTLTGCALVQAVMNAVMGTSPETVNDPPIQHIINFLQTIPGIGTAIATGLGIGRWGWVEIKHAQLIKEGKKDDNLNGVDDALEKPPPPPAPAA
jgi:hypothetical protein